MVFQNPVVAGGGALIRNSIHSPDYSAGVRGWSINKDGSAEFNSVTVRGSLTASDGSSSVVITNTANPRIQFYKNGVAEPSEIVGFRPFGTGVTGIQSSSANTVGHDRAIEQLDEFGWRILKNGTTVYGVDFADGGMAATLSNAAATFVPVVVDGKVLPVGSATTTSASTLDVAVTSANCVNVPVIIDRAYMATISVGLHSTIATDRAQFKLWNGSVGAGALLGTVNKKCNANASQFETVTMTFLWRASATEIIANLNLSVNRLSGTGTVSALVDQNYLAVVMEIGDAGNIGGL